MIKRLVPILGLLGAVIVLSGCAPAAEMPEGETISPTAVVALYQTATLAPSQVVVTEAPTPTPPPLPTPTPFMYTVVADDTMIAIAVRFGVTLDELQVANPEVNPNYLSIGTQLVIPVSFEDDEQPADQVLALEEVSLECTPVRSGGAWCFWLLRNPLDQPVENISGMIRLYDQDGELVAAQEAVSLLNVLAAGGQTPLGAFFAPGLDEWQLAQGQLVSSVTVNQYEARYIQGTIEELTVSIDQAGLGALVSGSLSLAAGQTPEYVWVLAVAYDAEGAVAGVRRWEAPSDQLNRSPVFSFEVFSLGRAIDRVDVFFEARAVQSSE